VAIFLASSPIYLACSPLFSFTAPAPAYIYPLSLHDALPIYRQDSDAPDTGRSHLHHTRVLDARVHADALERAFLFRWHFAADHRSEEHTSELQSRENLVCRLLLEKKKNKAKRNTPLKITDTC